MDQTATLKLRIEMTKSCSEKGDSIASVNAKIKASAEQEKAILLDVLSHLQKLGWKKATATVSSTSPGFIVEIK